MEKIIRDQFFSVFPLGVLTGILIVFRLLFMGEDFYAFLFWNIFLAIVPWGLSLCLIQYANKKYISLVLFFAWLFFFPNAPYVLTDFFHLKKSFDMPLWYDTLMLGSSTLLALYFGFLSFKNIHSILEEKFKPLISWMAIVGVSLLSGFGMYLGRFLRLNTWEVVTNPFGLMQEVLALLVKESVVFHLWGFSLGYGLFIFTGYFFVYRLLKQ